VIRDADIEDWRIHVWICDGNAVLRQVEVSALEEGMQQQHANLTIGAEIAANRSVPTDAASRKDLHRTSRGKTI